MADTVELLLEDLAEVVDGLAQILGPVTPGSIVARVSSIAIRGAGGVVHTIHAAELERIRQSEATGIAAGAAAYAASKVAGS